MVSRGIGSLIDCDSPTLSVWLSSVPQCHNTYTHTLRCHSHAGIVINNKNFTCGMKNRVGTDRDADALVKLFIHLGFYTNRYDDLKGKDMRKKLRVSCVGVVVYFNEGELIYMFSSVYIIFIFCLFYVSDIVYSCICIHSLLMSMLTYPVLAVTIRYKNSNRCYLVQFQNMHNLC